MWRSWTVQCCSATTEEIQELKTQALEKAAQHSDEGPAKGSQVLVHASSPFWPASSPDSTRPSSRERSSESLRNLSVAPNYVEARSMEKEWATLREEQDEVWKPNSRNFLALDTLRGVAALAVSFLHLSFSVPPVCKHPLHLSVDFFLVLSGFVLAKSYAFSTQRDSSPWHFIWRRASRLWPLQAFAALVTYVVLVHVVEAIPNSTASFVNLASEVLLLNGLGLPLGVDALNSPSWTVSCEFWLNVPYAFVARKVPAIGWLLCCVVGQVLLFFQFGSLATTGGVDGLVRCSTDFSLGAACYPLYVGLEAWGGQHLGLCSSTVVEVVLLVLVCCLFAEESDYASRTDFAAPWLFAAVVMCFACEGGLASKLLCHLRYLGLISYSIYLNHRVVLVLLWPGQPTFLNRLVETHINGQLEALILFWCLLLPYSCVTYHVVEMPSFKALLGSAAATPTIFDGRWADEGSWGTIKGNRFMSMDGLVGTLIIKGRKVVMTIGRDIHYGEIWEDGHLHWTDGDVWLRDTDHSPD